MRNKIFVLGLILMFLPSLTFAEFNLTISPEDTLFTIPNMLPGSFFSGEINLNNTGDVDIDEILFTPNFTNNCTSIESNGFCNLSGEEPRLTDVLYVNVTYDGNLIAQKTLTELGTGILLGPLSVGETKTLKLDISFGEVVGNAYQGTSAEINFVFYAGAPIYGSSIVINEIMYNPSVELGGLYNEWIELYNPTNEKINLTGWRIYDPSKHEFSILTTAIIEPRSYFILAKKPENFTQYYPDVSCPIAKVGFYLSNSGETINLTDNQGTLIDSVTYSSSWGANGNSKTLERKDVLGDSNLYTNWNESIPDNGTPGGLNSVVLWISDVSANIIGDLVFVSANITHYFNLLTYKAMFVRESDNNVYTIALSTTDNQIYNGIWNTSGTGSGKYSLYIPALDIRLNERLFNSNLDITKNFPPVITSTGGGTGEEPKKAYITITPTGATMKQNTTRGFEIEVRNIGGLEIKSFEVTAEDSEVENWINITPSKEKLGIGEIKFWTLTISVPENAGLGTRYFTIHANGDEIFLSTNFTLTIAKKPEIFIKEEEPEIPENIEEVPSDLMIIINNGDETTNSGNVKLTLYATNAIECRLNNDGIEWGNWEDYSILRDWELSPAPGTKTVYYQCRNEFGESQIIYETINYVVPKTTLPTGFAVLTNPTVLISIIGVLLLLLGLLFYRKKKK